MPFCTAAERTALFQSSYLNEAGYQTTEAEDGLKALEVFESGQFDLVLLDLMLPKLDGFGVCEWIRKKLNVPIVMLTALLRASPRWISAPVEHSIARMKSEPWVTA